MGRKCGTQGKQGGSKTFASGVVASMPWPRFMMWFLQSQEAAQASQHQQRERQRGQSCGGRSSALKHKSAGRDEKATTDNALMSMLGSVH